MGMLALLSWWKSNNCRAVNQSRTKMTTTTQISSATLSVIFHIQPIPLAASTYHNRESIVVTCQAISLAPAHCSCVTNLMYKLYIDICSLRKWSLTFVWKTSSSWLERWGTRTINVRALYSRATEIVYHIWLPYCLLVLSRSLIKTFVVLPKFRASNLRFMFSRISRPIHQIWHPLVLRWLGRFNPRDRIDQT